MSDDVWFLLTVALIVSMTLMFAAWVIARRMNNAGIADVAWAFGFTIVAAIFFAIGTGAPARRSLLAAILEFICGCARAVGGREPVTPSCAGDFREIPG